MIEARLAHCTNCQTGLQAVARTQVIRRQLTELPQIRPLVIETYHAEERSLMFHSLQRAVLPTGLEANRRFGPCLEATVVYLLRQQNMSSEHKTHSLHDLFGVELSEDVQACILKWADAGDPRSGTA